MSNTAIKVENLSKRYRIGLKEEMHDTFAGAITHYLKQPIRNLRRLRRLTTFEDDHKVEGGRWKGEDVRRNTQHDIIWALRDVSFEVERGEVAGDGTSHHPFDYAQQHWAAQDRHRAHRRRQEHLCFVDFSNRFKVLAGIRHALDTHGAP